MARKSQVKGRRGERELAALLQQHGYDVRPGEPMNCGEEADLVGLPDIHIECKRAETLRLSEWMEQSERDAARFGDGAPAVFFRRSRSPWCVVMKLEDWLSLYGCAHSCKCGGHCGRQKAEETGEKRS